MSVERPEIFGVGWKGRRCSICEGRDDAIRIDGNLLNQARTPRGDVEKAILVISAKASRNFRKVFAEAPITPHFAGEAALEPTPLSINIETVLKTRSVALDAGKRFDDIWRH